LIRDTLLWSKLPSPLYQHHLLTNFRSVPNSLKPSDTARSWTNRRGRSLGIEKIIIVEFFRPFTSPSPPCAILSLTTKRNLISANEKPVLASITSSVSTGTIVERLATPS
jgi:hypothetical protein